MKDDELKYPRLRKTMQRGMTNWRNKLFKPEFQPDDFQLEDVEVDIPGLDPVFEDYRIVNISDIHLGQWITPKHLEGVIELVNEQNPDMVAITGDFVSYIFEDVARELEASLKELKPKDLSIATLGNHDHWLGADKIRGVLKKSGIVDVSNDVYTLRRGEAQLHIAGVDSVMLEKHRLDLVMEKLPEEGPAILLAHEPDFADISSTTGRFSLQISGHSHGGQFVIPGLGTIIRGPHFVKYPLGKYKVKNMVQYTSRGLGTNVFWFRINCDPEITVFTLKGAS
ncbi:MAG TPA: metallophosphoesterase [Methanobacteriaceae archaeon]|jgi:predicted MPP superfamily phosphohydrolase|nr:metallophosphoesterase [Methanobacteriaceae archaeon]OPY22991.1 MAG: phosphodiesterase YaeI [Methanobacterium sp. PtaU1.Bin097]HNR26707.1 metallophosphoesterase [Methanobacteriaceae archaeon]